MKHQHLSESEIITCLRCLPQWKYIPSIPAIEKEFVFDNFLHAIEFMYKSAPFIDKINHHPEWKNVYNRVHVILYTHEVKGVTVLDIQLAHYLENLYQYV
ncbi:MAG: 4a-hydroxytetrahydrobiopterin dehydratase [Bacteroidia bacterium]|nr:4a-hydroxytetrahydrobiopterin dehydratase [Bacteroidia bacterium]MDW8347035.1 4a-hydroxytetrahydrobiopterin dehydratase [Bacteroidia bacterium]